MVWYWKIMNLFNDAYAQIANDKATGNSEMNPVKNFILGRCRAGD